MENDKKYLHQAIEIAKESVVNGGGPFGAVIVKADKVIAKASNRVVLNNDPTAHAEILAIRQASTQLQTFELNDCILYTSCEPCPMCLGAIYWSGIRKVVYSSDRTDAERAGFDDKFIYNEIMLEPSERGITFIRSSDPAGEDVFRMWNEKNDKIVY
jgi:tRNA(Arg) A34 adenosine deaminase TadA